MASRTKYFIVVPLLAICLTWAYQSWRRLANWPTVRQEIRQRFPQVPQVSVEDLVKELQDLPPGAPSRPLLLDVRQAEEYAVSHLPGARRLDPSLTAPQLGAEVAKDQPIVVYCSVGYRSSLMAERLQAQGYSSVRNLEGSIFEWANRGLPLEQDGRPTEGVHPYDRFWGRLLESELHRQVPAADEP